MSLNAAQKAPIIGHQKTLSFIAGAIEKGRLAHAYLFAGPEHAGKCTAAKELARMLLTTADLSTHPDFVFVERERDAKTGKLHGSIVLEQIHALTGRLALGAFIGGRKVCIIDGAETMTTEAANALLKTLEEPRPNTVLILLAAAEGGVLPTIASRCQVMRFGRTSTTEIAEALVARGATASQAALYAGLSGGLPGKAIRYAENPAQLDDMYAVRESLLRWHALPVAERWASIDKMIPAKTPFQEAGDLATRVIDLASELLHDAMLAAAGAEATSGAAPMHADVAARTAAWAQTAGLARLSRAAERVSDSRALIDGNVNPRTALERLALSF